jgi:hypothetical protein
MGIMGIVAVYVGTAMLLAPTIFVAVQWVGHENVPRRRRRLSYSVLAALMWPVLVLGLVQFLLILAVRKALHRDAFVIASTSDPDEGPVSASRWELRPSERSRGIPMGCQGMTTDSQNLSATGRDSRWRPIRIVCISYENCFVSRCSRGLPLGGTYCRWQRIKGEKGVRL